MTQNPEKILADALVDGIVVLNADGLIRWCNKEAGKLLDINNKKNIFIKDILNSDRFSNFLTYSYGEMLELYAPHNPNVRLSIYLRPYLHDQKVLIIQDITARYRLEKIREDFIANVSHELRTPLTVFHGYLEMLLDNQQVERLNLKKIFEQMNYQGRRMERLVQDLLLLSRLESEDKDIAKHEVVNVTHLIRQIYQDACSIAKELKHEFILDLDEALTMMGEPHELRSAFSNIIVNAVRYTPQGGEIIIKWFQDKFGKHFEVKDTGIGIEAKHIDRITQRFYRVDKARSREMGGTGLGLAIVKHVLIRHSGELSIKSTPNVGSTFKCSFPGSAQ